MDGLDVRRRIVLGEPSTQQRLEEMVIAKPGALFVQGDDKEVGAADGTDKGFAVKPFVARRASFGRLGGVEQGGAEAVKKRGLQQDGTLGRGEASQHFGQQVFSDGFVAVAGDLAGKGDGVGMAAQGKRRQLEPHRPPLRAVLQQGGGLGDGFRRDLRTEQLLEQQPGLLGY